MRNMDQRKWIPILFCIASACYMFTGFMQMFADGNVSTGLIFMSLGWMNLALATIWKKKADDHADQVIEDK